MLINRNRSAVARPAVRHTLLVGMLCVTVISEISCCENTPLKNERKRSQEASSSATLKSDSTGPASDQLISAKTLLLTVVSCPEVVAVGESVPIEIKVRNDGPDSVICGSATDLLPGITISGTDPTGSNISLSDFAHNAANSFKLNPSNTVKSGQSYLVKVNLDTIVNLQMIGTYFIAIQAEGLTFTGDEATSRQAKVRLKILGRKRDGGANKGDIHL
jgi:hypothetical protein